MALEAPLSRYKRNNVLVYMGICVVLAGWFGYDGYLSEKFRQKYTNEDGTPSATLVFHRKSPPFFAAAAALLAAYLFAIKDRKIVAGENALVIRNKEKIPYDSIERIDKTHFDKKGSFIITYKDKDGSEVNRKLSDRQYDNLGPILDHLVAKIS